MNLAKHLSYCLYYYLKADILRVGGGYGVYSVFCVGRADQMKIISKQADDGPALVCIMTRDGFTIRPHNAAIGMKQLFPSNNQLYSALLQKRHYVIHAS